MDKAKIQKAVRMILEAIGEDTEREGLQKTPERVAQMYEEIFSGITKDPSKELTVHLPDIHSGVVSIKDIKFYSVCEHHLLPFFGKIDIVYLPRDGKVTGLSKITKAIDVLSRRLQLQERLTDEIVRLLEDVLKAEGVLVVIEAEHLCMSMRGVKKEGSMVTTMAYSGIYEEKMLRQEALAILGRGTLD